ncbi:hypothetical protein E2C01_023515 [Portunus trituberculatus]|uniref:Uncharacterized protein n=1 Tax=Portunus trituberculatus TaxID=210409 RepID=A0A5B7EA95_PORTR|nr:hypothetical protein [Portunus trituberculatus]
MRQDTWDDKHQTFTSPLTATTLTPSNRDRGGLGFWVVRTAVKLCLFSRRCLLLGPRRRGATAEDCTRGEEGEGPMLGGEAEVVGEGREGSGLVTTDDDEDDDSI